MPASSLHAYRSYRTPAISLKDLVTLARRDRTTSLLPSGGNSARVTTLGNRVVNFSAAAVYPFFFRIVRSSPATSAGGIPVQKRGRAARHPFPYS